MTNTTATNTAANTTAAIAATAAKAALENPTLKHIALEAHLDGATGSTFVAGITPEIIVDAIKQFKNVEEIVNTENLLIIELDGPDGLLKAKSLHDWDWPDNILFKVEALGPHPTLVPLNIKIEPEKTKRITIIIETAGEEAVKDAADLGLPPGTPVLATVFPGPCLDGGPNKPGPDEKIGTVYNREQAINKSWNIVKF